MGAVYEVEHEQLGVHYALKTFTFEGGHDKLLKNKFLAEGKVLARLQNPHLVHVFDLNFDEVTGTPYFVMDLVLDKDGEPHTLADVKADNLEEDQILQWFGELASALDYIHQQGIVHRDIKLGNVLLSADGHVVLSDFGVSRFFSERLRADVNVANTIVSEIMTGHPVIMGTQGYMAPEVLRGEEATPAADAYSLGVMFVHLLTGILYEPGSKVFRLLETLEYRWADVLPRLLSENPKERPTKLSELARLVRQVAEPSRGVSSDVVTSADDVSLPHQSEKAVTTVSNFAIRLKWRKGWIAGGIAIIVIVILSCAAFFIGFSRNDTSVPDAFSASGIYEDPSR